MSGDHAGDVGQLAQGVHHGQVRQADVAKLDAAAAEHPHPPPAGPVGQGQQQPGLAQPGVARQQNHLRAALPGPLQHRIEPARLDRPADERRARGLPSHARQYGRLPTRA